MEEEKECEKTNDSIEEVSEPDYSSLNKYFIEDSEVKKEDPVSKVKTIVEDIAISESPFSSFEKEKESLIESMDVEKELIDEASVDTESRKEFLKELDDDSLNLDTCSNVSRDWGRK